MIGGLFLRSLVLCFKLTSDWAFFVNLKFLIKFSCSYLKNKLRDPNFFIVQKPLAGQDKNLCKVLKNSVEQIQSYFKFSII